MLAPEGNSHCGGMEIWGMWGMEGVSRERVRVNTGEVSLFLNATD